MSMVKVEIVRGNAVYIDGVPITRNHQWAAEYNIYNIEKTFYLAQDEVIAELIRKDPILLRNIGIDPYDKEARLYTRLWPDRKRGDMTVAKKKNWTPVVLSLKHKNYLFIKRYIIENCRFVHRDVKQRDLFGTNQVVAKKIWLEDTKCLLFLSLKYEWNIDLSFMASVRSERERRGVSSKSLSRLI